MIGGLCIRCQSHVKILIFNARGNARVMGNEQCGYMFVHDKLSKLWWIPRVGKLFDTWRGTFALFFWWYSLAWQLLFQFSSICGRTLRICWILPTEVLTNYPCQFTTLSPQSGYLNGWYKVKSICGSFLHRYSYVPVRVWLTHWVNAEYVQILFSSSISIVRFPSLRLFLQKLAWSGK